MKMKAVKRILIPFLEKEEEEIDRQIYRYPRGNWID